MSQQSKLRRKAGLLLAVACLSAASLSVGIGSHASLLLAALLIIGAATVGLLSEGVRRWLPFILCVKALYALDLVFAMHDGRTLRYVPLDLDEAFGVRAEAFLILSIWLASFTSAFAISGRPGLLRCPNVSDRRRLPKLCLLLVLGSQISFLAILWKVGGLGSMLAGMSSRYELYHGIGALRVFVAAAGVGCALMVLGGSRRTVWFVGIVLFVELTLLGGRSFALFSVLLPLIMVWTGLRGSIPFRSIAPISVVIVLFVVMMGEYRSSQLEDRYNVTNNPVVRMASDTGAADNFPSLLFLLKGRYIHFEGGSLIAAGLLAPIPRAIWPNKPVADEAAAIGVVLAGADDVNWGLPIGPHGLAYYAGGPVGVPVLGMLSGLVAAWVINSSRRKVGYAAVAPLLLLLVPDMFSPAVAARILFLAGLAVTINAFLKVKFRREIPRS